MLASCFSIAAIFSQRGQLLHHPVYERNPTIKFTKPHGPPP